MKYLFMTIVGICVVGCSNPEDDAAKYMNSNGWDSAPKECHELAISLFESEGLGNPKSGAGMAMSSSEAIRKRDGFEACICAADLKADFCQSK